MGGTTGEGHLMSWDEHIMLIAHTVNCFGDAIKVTPPIRGCQWRLLMSKLVTLDCNVSAAVTGPAVKTNSKKLLSRCVQIIVFQSCSQVIGNTGSNSTREAMHASEQGFAVGMHAALHINPYYGKTSKDGLLAHFK